MNIYTAPELMGPTWVIVELDPEGVVLAEYGYPTQAAAWAAFDQLTAEAKEDAPDA